jgi:hypothetical protein
MAQIEPMSMMKRLRVEYDPSLDSQQTFLFCVVRLSRQDQGSSSYRSFSTLGKIANAQFVLSQLRRTLWLPDPSMIQSSFDRLAVDIIRWWIRSTIHLTTLHKVSAGLLLRYWRGIIGSWRRHLFYRLGCSISVKLINQRPRLYGHLLTERDVCLPKRGCAPAPLDRRCGDDEKPHQHGNEHRPLCSDAETGHRSPKANHHEFWLARYAHEPHR